MADMALTTRRLAGRIDWTLVVVLGAFAVLAVLAGDQAVASALFVGDALLGVAPFLFASIAIAAYAKASGADGLIARAFEGREVTMIGAAALMGALSPFCSCGVIPLIAALLSMGVPLAPVMAFWLASPLMDPSMFFLTAGTLGMDFALYKVFAAIAVGLIGGFGTYAVVRAGGFGDPLREGVGNGGCGASSVRAPKQVVWKFWDDQGRREKFAKNAWETTLFLGKWLAVAFFLESLMLAYIPAETVSAVIGGEGWLPVLGATLVGVPAYLNGYAALPLVGGLIEQGMAPGAGMAFLLAGGVSSIPAMIAVWALARPHVFAVYLGFAFVGAFSMGALYGVIA
ncbi:MAG: permease [Thalassobaculaceae bacterium]|nr:permease [Thalassobaculaceae bacterium]